MRRAKSGKDLNSSEDCLRGLERHFESDESSLDEKRSHAINVVLEEQTKQLEWGIQDEEFLADLCREVTMNCQDVASFTGFRDSREIFFPDGFFPDDHDL